MKNLPAGGYYAIAVEYLAQGEWGDPDVLERLKGNATKFTLAKGKRGRSISRLTLIQSYRHGGRPPPGRLSFWNNSVSLVRGVVVLIVGRGPCGRA